MKESMQMLVFIVGWGVFMWLAGNLIEAMGFSPTTAGEVAFVLYVPVIASIFG
jgi:hypothetical protein